MNVKLKNIGKRFNREWIFRNLNFEFSEGENSAILGGNGSGKSTLLQLISANISASEGEIIYDNGPIISSDEIFRYLSFASPYLELPEEYTLEEAIRFHKKFKKFRNNFSVQKIISLTELENSKNKQLKNFSSGMKQRVRLALAVLSDTPLLLLDEPCSNLDKQGIDWYRNLISENSSGRLIIVCSNHQFHEHDFCKTQLNVMDFKSEKYTERI